MIDVIFKPALRRFYNIYYGELETKGERVMDTKWLKIGSVVCSVVSAAAAVASTMITEKQTDEKIAAKVAEALAKATN